MCLTENEANKKIITRKFFPDFLDIQLKLFNNFLIFQ